MLRRASIALALLTIPAALASCGSDPHADAPRTAAAAPGAWPAARPASTDAGATPTLAAGVVRVTRVASFDDTVTALASDPQRRALFVATRHGTIFRIPVETTDHVAHPGTPKVELDLSGSVSDEDERGMLALQPVDGGRRLAVSYTASDGAVTVRLLRVDGTHLVDDVPDATVLRVPHPYAGHNGGGLATTADGDLLLSLGDMASGDLAQPLAQDRASVLGGIVRIPAARLAGGPRPVDATPALLVAKGLRNPWRIAVDPVSDTLWLGDVGESTWEEIDEMPSITTHHGITNFGWPAMEGDATYRAGVPLLGGTSTAPEITYRHTATRCAVSLGGVYRGGAIAAFDGALVFGDDCSGQISAVDARHPHAARPVAVATVGQGTIVSFARDAHADLYALTSGGGVYRLDPPGWHAADVTATTKAPAVTATTAPATAVECRSASAIKALSSYASLAPGPFQAALDTVVATLTDAARHAPAGRRSTYELLRVSFDRLRTVAASAGYVATAPTVADLASNLYKGTGQGAGFPEAVSKAMGTATGC